MSEKTNNVDEELLRGDLDRLLEVEGTSKAEEIRETVDDHGLTEQEFRNRIPDEILRLGLLLVQEEQREELRESLSGELKEDFDKATDIAHDILSGITEHPVVGKWRREEAESRENPFRFNVITNVSGLSTSIKTEEGLAPTVRIGFTDSDGETLLESTLGWYELVHVASRLIEILENELYEWEDIHKSGYASIYMLDEVKQGIENISDLSSDMNEVISSYLERQIERKKE